MILLTSLSYAETYIIYDSDIEEKTKTFVVYDQPKTQTYHVSHKLTGKERLRNIGSMEKKKFWIKMFHDQEKLEECIKKRTKNWHRRIGGKKVYKEEKSKEGKDIITDTDTEGRAVFGHNRKEDFRLRNRMWKDIRKGKKVC